MTKNNQNVIDFALRITSLGFKVYVAAEGMGQYGFITDESESRVLSFSFTDGASLSGNYGPPSQESGTGWRMDGTPYDLATADDIRNALYSRPARYAGNGWKKLSTVADYLADYQSSSCFKLV